MTSNLTNINPDALSKNPSILPMLRIATAPPIARDRLIGLADVQPNLVSCMELDNRVPPKMNPVMLDAELKKIACIIMKLIDTDLFPWLEKGYQPVSAEVHRAATIVADRLCGAVADPIIRNAKGAKAASYYQKMARKSGVFVYQYL
jgi:hypothetical protein